MPSPDLLQAIAGLGATGFLLLGIWALGTGRVRVGSLVDGDKASLAKERDDWKAIAQAALAKLDANTAGLERLTTALDRMESQRAMAIAEAVDAITKRLGRK